MAIMRWDPFGELVRMQREMDQLFSRMAPGGEPGQRQSAWMPKIDVKQQDQDMLVRAELPGLKPEDVDIEVSQGILTIKGERKVEEQKENEGYIVRESSYGFFQRSVALPENVDPNSIKADYNEGVLEVRVPGAFAEVQPQRVKVAIGGAQQQPAMQGQAEGQQQGTAAEQRQPETAMR